MTLVGLSRSKLAVAFMFLFPLIVIFWIGSSNVSFNLFGQIVQFETFIPENIHNNFSIGQTNIDKSWTEAGCNQTLRLNNFSEDYSHTNEQIFFVETKNKKSLNGRFSCGIESAILRSNLKVKVLFRASYVNLSESESFCNLVLSYYPDRVEFFTIDIEELMRHTPQEGILPRWRACPPHLHYNFLSDLLRHPLLYKYGGFYSDLDVLTLKSLKGLRNLYGIEGFFKK